MRARCLYHPCPLRSRMPAQPIPAQPRLRHRVGGIGRGLPAPVGTAGTGAQAQSGAAQLQMFVLQGCLVVDTTVPRPRLSPSRLQLSLGPVGTGAPVGTDRLRLSLEWLRRTGCRAMKRRPMRSGLAPCLALAQQRLSLQRLSLQRLSLQASSALMQKHQFGLMGATRWTEPAG